MNENTEYVKKPESREEWLSIRKTGIGGSDVASILGLSPWRTETSLFLNKTGAAEDQAQSLAMRIGNELEDFAAKLYCEQTGYTVRNYGYMIRKGHSIADVDRLVSVDGSVPAHHEDIRTDTILECKTTGHIWGDEVPAYYQTQVQHYLGLTGCRYCDVAVMFRAPFLDFKIYRIERDDALIRAIQDRVEGWWSQHIVAGVAPDPSNLGDAKALYVRSNGATVTADNSVVEAVSAMVGIKKEIEEREQALENLQGIVCGAIGEAETIVAPDGTKLATWKNTKDRQTVDYKAAATSAGIDLKPFTTVKPGSRVFRLAV